MSDLLTAGDYWAIAETMTIGANAFIDGIARGPRLRARPSRP